MMLKEPRGGTWVSRGTGGTESVFGDVWGVSLSTCAGMGGVTTREETVASPGEEEHLVCKGIRKEYFSWPSALIAMQ